MSDIPPIDDTDETKVNPANEQQALDVLGAEQLLLEKLLKVADDAVIAAAAQNQWTSDWLSKYWQGPLREHLYVTKTWKDGIDLTAVNSRTRAAAHMELDAVVEVRRLVQQYMDRSLNDQTAQAFQNWINDLTLEAQAKKALIQALKS